MDRETYEKLDESLGTIYERIGALEVAIRQMKRDIVAADIPVNSVKYDFSRLNRDLSTMLDQLSTSFTTLSYFSDTVMEDLYDTLY